MATGDTKTKAGIKRDIEFLYEIGTLRNTERSWRQFLGIECASVLEHTARVAFLALIIARGEGYKDEEKILKMALTHDLSETRTGDTNYVQALYTKRSDDEASKDTFVGTSLHDLYSEILHEYEKRETLASKIVKDADNLDVDIEMKEFEDRGSITAKKLQVHRKIVRHEKLYTETAQKIWDEIQNSNPTSWHLAKNKWVKVKKAGR